MMDLYEDEDDAEFERQGPDGRQQEQSRPPPQEEEEEESEDESNRPVKRGRYEEEEEDEDEEDDEDEVPTSKKGRQRRKARIGASRFLDVEAEVDEDDEEEEDEDDYATKEFFAGGENDDDDEDLVHSRVRNNDFDRTRDMDEQDLEKLAKDLTNRYNKGPVRFNGDMNEVPQRLLMPSVHDCSLWQIRVKAGRERELVFSLMRKAMDLEYTAHPMHILSCFQRDSLPGLIYVEARSSAQVTQACLGLVGIFGNRPPSLVPIEEMASLLQIKKQEQTVNPGSWVRIKRGKYGGDLAQVMDITENGEDIGLKFIPRIDLNPKDEISLDGRKRKKAATGTATMRPPQRLFNFEEVIKVYGRKMVSKRNQVYVFQNDTYRGGFIEKDFKLNSLSLEDVSPTLDEITQFTRGEDGTEAEGNVDLSIIAEASRKAAISVLQPGDHVEVFEGEQTGVHGVVEGIDHDVVTITAIGVDFEGQKVDLPARSVRKRFKPGDHVKVMTGQNADETGLVVSVEDHIVTFMSDMSMKEISVFSKDLREAAEVGSGTNTVGNYELHDLVSLDPQTVGVIYKTERDTFRVLDQNGHERIVQPHQISMRRDTVRAIATDSTGHEIRPNDNMKEVEGETRKGRVLHVHQSYFAFLHNREIAEHGGVFVTRARNLTSLAPKSNVSKLTGDLSKMNPAASGGAAGGGMVGSGNMGRGPRDRLIGVLVNVIKGNSKGHVGTIKDTNGNMARVELNSGNKVITIEKDKLRRRHPNGSVGTAPLESNGFGGGPGGGGGGHNNMGPPMGFGATSGRTPNPYAAQGGKTPGWGAGGRTPYTEGKTPAWNISSATPNPYGTSKTPAWNATAASPNPYLPMGGKTPGWGGGSTPNPYAAAAASGYGGAGGFGGATPGRPSFGGATPGRPSFGGATPGRPSFGSATPAPVAQGWGGATPGGAGGSSWGATTGADPWGGGGGWGANAASAPTPGYGSAPTPSFAPTPYGNHYGTPGMASAPTPNGGGMPIWGEDGGPVFELPTTWLADPYLQNIQMIVEIRNTRGDPGWWDGEHEGRRGYVDSVSLVGEGFTHTACIKSLPGERGFETLSVPLKFLHPVHPTTINEVCIVVAGGMKGKKKVIKEITGQQVVIGGFQSEEYHDIMINRLAKLYQPAAA